MSETITTTNTQSNTKKEKSKGGRSFKVKLSTEGELYGRYNGDSPYQAANKALSELIRNKLKNNEVVEQAITFFLVESTKGSNKKVHEYTGHRIKLDNPVQYTVAGGQVITKEYKNVLRKVRKQTNLKTKRNKKTE